MEPFVFHRSARSWLTAGVIAGVLAALWAFWYWLDAAVWIVLIVGAFTLPALADMARNAQSGLTLNATDLSWFSVRRHAKVSLDEIDHIRLDTRFDFSVRVSVVLRTGRRIRLPYECSPAHLAFEAALLARNLKVERHHFQLSL